MKSVRSVTGSELGMGTPALSANGLGLGMGVGMGLGMGPQNGIPDGLGVGNLVVQDVEEERLRRVRVIVDMLGSRWGRVSREGVERCARRLGLECLWEDAVIQGEGEKRSTLSIAGNGLLIDIEWVGEGVTNVILSFPGAGDGAEASAGRGAEVLREDLIGREGTRGYVGLKAFAENLGVLAGMDVLGRDGVSCFEAVEGVRTSLGRLWTWDLAKVREERGTSMGSDDEKSVMTEVLCKRSGRPTMHENGKIGLRLDYWTDSRLVPSRKRKADEMDVDQPKRATKADNPIHDASSLPKVYSLLIDCGPCPASLYPSLRISNAWLSNSVEKKPSLDDSLYTADPNPIDWQEPPPTFKPNPEPEPEAMTLDSHIALPGTLPDIRFIAHLDPPVTLPLQKAMEIFALLGSPLAQESLQMTTYTGLLIPEKGSEAPKSLLQNSTLQFERTVRLWNEDDTSITSTHEYSLLTNQQDWARTITEIPFSHPKQLVVIMPLLRQWAFLGGVLRRSFGFDDLASAKTVTTTRRSGIDNSKQRNINKATGTGKMDRRARQLTPPSDTDSDSEDTGQPMEDFSETKMPVRRSDVELSLAEPMTPSVTISIPGSESGERTVTFHIGLNAEIAVEVDGDHEDRAVEKKEGSIDEAMEGVIAGEGSRRLEDLGQVLAIAEDLGVCVEWALR